MTALWGVCLFLAVLSTAACAIPGWLLDWRDRPARYGWRLAAALSWALAMFSCMCLSHLWSLSWWIGAAAAGVAFSWVRSSWQRWETLRRKAGTR